MTNLTDLAVSGASTVGGTLDITGALTVGGSSTIGGASLAKYSQSFLFSEMTDADATGTLELSTTIPIGAYVLACNCTALVGFTNDTSATVTVGDGSDVDRYMTGTPSVFTTAANGVALGIPSGVPYHAAAKTPTVVITTNADFTSVNAGSMTLEIFYLT